MILKLLKLNNIFTVKILLCIIFLSGALLFLSSCCQSFHWPPPVNNASDVMNLDPSVTWIRAGGLSDNDIYALASRKNIEKLDFCFGYVAPNQIRLTDQGLKTLADLNLPRLDRLELGHCDHISDEGLLYISRMKQIKSLYFGWYNGFSNTGLSYLSNMDKLEELCFQECKEINDEGLEHLSKMRSLELLTIYGSKDITDEGLKHISCLEKLKSLYLQGAGNCNKVTDEGLNYLSTMKQLKTLVLPCSPNISNDAIIKLKQALPDCDISIAEYKEGYDHNQ